MDQTGATYRRYMLLPTNVHLFVEPGKNHRAHYIPPLKTHLQLAQEFRRMSLFLERISFIRGTDNVDLVGN